MTAASETRYARSGETSVAYQVLGEGPTDLIYVPGFLSHLEWNWQYPPVARFLETLASFSRLIVWTSAGRDVGPGAGRRLPTLEQRMDDVRAVMDAVGSERAASSVSPTGAPVLLFAADLPERTVALATLPRREVRAGAPSTHGADPPQPSELRSAGERSGEAASALGAPGAQPAGDGLRRVRPAIAPFLRARGRPRADEMNT